MFVGIVVDDVIVIAVIVIVVDECFIVVLDKYLLTYGRNLFVMFYT